MTRHKRRCKEKYGTSERTRIVKGITAVTRQEGRRTGICDRCGSELLKKNMARHRGTCGVEVMRKRKRCQYCGKDLTEGYIKKHAIVCKKK